MYKTNDGNWALTQVEKQSIRELLLPVLRLPGSLFFQDLKASSKYYRTGSYSPYNPGMTTELESKILQSINPEHRHLIVECKFYEGGVCQSGADRYQGWGFRIKIRN